MEPEPAPARDENETSKRGQRTGPFLTRIERENVKTARKQNDAGQPADHCSASGRPPLPDGEQGQRMDPLIKKGGVPEIEAALLGQKIVKELISRVGGQRTQDNGEQGKRGSKAKSQTIG